MSDRIDKILEGESQLKRKFSLLQPFLFALMLIFGIYIGFTLNKGGMSNPLSSQAANANPNKLVNIINKIDEMYVDSVEKKKLIDDAIKSIVDNLDPHSYYISPEELTSMQEPLEGNFEGIGVEFMIQKDTLMVINPIEGGPSEEAGILAGDRIIKVEGEVIAGIGLTNDKVTRLLKGKKGTVVNLSIQRRGKSDLIQFEIERDKIPIYSVVASLNITPEIGYIKVTRFAKYTFEEFKEAIDGLAAEGASQFIIDLRGNGGGYLNSCIPMIEEFLGQNKLIVYTEGNNDPRRDYKSRINGKYKNIDVVVLINQGSASASEILAGALQDHDRSITVGRRSFGKGLVQNEVPLPDQSALRLTVARYYTPTGRSIQKPYGEGIDYANDYLDRYDHGELLSADSIRFSDSLSYRTPAGRIVYGGGGIMPDIFVPIDTVGSSAYLNELTYSGIFRTYGFQLAERIKDQKEAFPTVDDLINGFELSDQDLEGLYDYASQEGITKDRFGIENSKKVLGIRLMAQLARNWYGEEGYYRVILEDDTVFDKAMEVMSDYEAYQVTDGKLNLLKSELLEE